MRHSIEYRSLLLIADSNSKYPGIFGNQCLTCGKVLATKATAKRHFDMTHAAEMGSTVNSPPCMICGKVFKHDLLLKCHLRKMHNIYKAQYEKVYD